MAEANVRCWSIADSSNDPKADLQPPRPPPVSAPARGRPTGAGASGGHAPQPGVVLVVSGFALCQGRDGHAIVAVSRQAIDDVAARADIDGHSTGWPRKPPLGGGKFECAQHAPVLGTRLRLGSGAGRYPSIGLSGAECRGPFSFVGRAFGVCEQHGRRRPCGPTAA